MTFKEKISVKSVVGRMTGVISAYNYLMRKKGRVQWGYVVLKVLVPLNVVCTILSIYQGFALSALANAFAVAVGLWAFTMDPGGNRIKYLWQRLTRGFSDEDLWSLDSTIAKFVIPRLKAFKKMGHGYPRDLTPEKWSLLLDEMIWAFEWTQLDLLECGTEESLINSPEDLKAQEDRCAMGLALFAKYFWRLWD